MTPTEAAAEVLAGRLTIDQAAEELRPLNAARWPTASYARKLVEQAIQIEREKRG